MQVLQLVGMANLTYLSLEDQAMLCLIEKYVKFRQGDLWKQIKEEFELEVGNTFWWSCAIAVCS